MQDSVTALKNERVFIIFGTGKFAREVFLHFIVRNIDVICFVDNDVTRHGYFMGKPVFGPECLSSIDVPIVICSSWHKDILKQLSKLENKGVVYIADPFLSVFDDLDLGEEIMSEILTYYKEFDEDSRGILTGIIGLRVGQIDLLKISNYSQYFHPLMSFNENDVIIDGGSYVGDTVQNFEKKNIRVKEFHCFEPDASNFKKLSQIETSAELHLNNVGLWSESGNLNFSSSDESISYGCKINKEGSGLIKVISIDDYCRENNISPTVIKMDIEGAEREALLGAKDTIVKMKPKLAISVYHKYDDVWKVQKIIKEMRPDYQFYLGHHTSSWMETILYAI